MYPVLIFLIAFIIVYIYSNRKITPIGIVLVILITIILSNLLGCFNFNIMITSENFNNKLLTKDNHNIHSAEDDNNSIWNKYDRNQNDEEGDIFEYNTNMTQSATNSSELSCDFNKSNECIFDGYNKIDDVCTNGNGYPYVIEGLKSSSNQVFVDWLAALYNRNGGTGEPDNIDREAVAVKKYLQRCINKPGYEFLKDIKFLDTKTLFPTTTTSESKNVATTPATTVDKIEATTPATTVDKIEATTPATTVDKIGATTPATTVDKIGATTVDKIGATTPATTVDKIEATIPATIADKNGGMTKIATGVMNEKSDKTYGTIFPPYEEKPDYNRQLKDVLAYNFLNTFDYDQADFEQKASRNKLKKIDSTNKGYSDRLFDNALNENSLDVLNGNKLEIDPDNQNLNINVIYNINDEMEDRIKNMDNRLRVLGEANAEILKDLSYLDMQQGKYQKVQPKVQKRNIGEELESGGIPSTSWLRRLFPGFERAPETVDDINEIVGDKKNNKDLYNKRYNDRNNQNMQLSRDRMTKEKNSVKLTNNDLYGYTYTDPKTWANINKSFNPNLLQKSSGVTPTKTGNYFKVEQ